MPQPSIQKNNVVTANTMKFLDRMLTVFFARQKPGLHRRESQVHEEHEHRGNQHPNRIGPNFHVAQLGCKLCNGVCWSIGRRRVSGRFRSRRRVGCRRFFLCRGAIRRQSRNEHARDRHRKHPRFRSYPFNGRSHKFNLPFRRMLCAQSGCHAR